MILYHGTNINIEKIDLSKCRPFKDFGQGFYLTTIPEQAERMAFRTVKRYGGTPLINIYEVDNLDRLNIKRFPVKPTIEWAEFIINNRNPSNKNISDVNCNLDCKYDVVIGPVADDDVSVLLRQFTRHYINADILTKELTFRSLTDQYSFHTYKSIWFLKKVGVRQCINKNF